MTAKTKLSPRKAAEEVLQLLRNSADETRAASYQRYFKEPVDILGVDKTTMVETTENLIGRIGDAWTIKQAVQFCKLMVRDPHMESRSLGFQVVAAFVSDASPSLLVDVKRWLQHSCGNWALVDGTIAPSILAPLLRRYPDLIIEVVSWTESPSQWVRRSTAVAYVSLVAHKKHVATGLKIAERLFDDEEDLVHKAVGWLLREVGKSDKKRLDKFLLKHGPKIPRTTVRYAIERFPKDERKQMLQATKGKP